MDVVETLCEEGVGGKVDDVVEVRLEVLLLQEAERQLHHLALDPAEGLASSLLILSHHPRVGLQVGTHTHTHRGEMMVLYTHELLIQCYSN